MLNSKPDGFVWRIWRLCATFLRPGRPFAWIHAGYGDDKRKEEPPALRSLYDMIRYDLLYMLGPPPPPPFARLLCLIHAVFTTIPTFDCLRKSRTITQEWSLRR